MTTVAIMQPTYLPWLGYFGMIDRADCFVLLDTVQFARRSWQQRNQIKTAHGAQWLTVPVFSKGRRDQAVSEVEIDKEAGFPGKHISAIQHAYGKAGFFEPHFGDLRGILAADWRYLCELNLRLIGWLNAALGITTPIRRASEFPDQQEKSERLAALCESLGAARYLAAPGSKDYLAESDAFRQRGIAVVYHEYVHPTYPQLFGEFLPFMSVIDLLFNAGPESLAIIRRGYGP